MDLPFPEANPAGRVRCYLGLLSASLLLGRAYQLSIGADDNVQSAPTYLVAPDSLISIDFFFFGS